ncbi:hypothetical protein DMC64_41680 [Amycolatopsis sp. WAC 04197]|uniref:hypothetical protein n=1 Tax=Amycolatopsis sp. WAC 04197 TaxID=2203199 RepID=UPI000F79CA7C|nr:hypothetical protein [Amycolatopsis sp. WAC 04197]RSN38581.1 hypothetical protein DMC64_41680 [Amycolatopsis sp. WAC 04197]
MGLSTYNGFSGAQRERVQSWLTREFAAGRIERPTQCESCGQNEGVIDAHHENYDEPTSFVGLCVICHLALHCRFRNTEGFLEYRRRVAEGYQHPAVLDRRTALGELQRTVMKGVFPGRVRPDAPGATFLDSLRVPQPAQLW